MTYKRWKIIALILALVAVIVTTVAVIAPPSPPIDCNEKPNHPLCSAELCKKAPNNPFCKNNVLCEKNSNPPFCHSENPEKYYRGEFAGFSNNTVIDGINMSDNRRYIPVIQCYSVKFPYNKIYDACIDTYILHAERSDYYRTNIPIFNMVVIPKPPRLI